MLIASCAFLALTAAVTNTDIKKNSLAQRKDCCVKDRVIYDYECIGDREELNLQNDITIYGPKVVLVNLDDRRQIHNLELEGIFVQEGDLIFITGREYTCAW